MNRYRGVEVCVCVCGGGGGCPHGGIGSAGKKERKSQMGPLTSLVGGDVDGGVLGGVGALVRHAVDGLHLEGVLRVGQQVADVDAGLRQAQLTGQELHVVAAARAAAAAAAAALADDVEDDVLAAPRVPGARPLQHHGGLVHAGDDGLRRRRHGWRKETQETLG